LVILAAGAWSRRLAKMAGVELPLRWVHGEALVTESLPPLARHGMATSAFFEATEGTEGQTVGFCLNQRPEGNVMIGEAAAVTDRLSRRVTAAALPAIAAEARRFFPGLRPAAVIRSWASPVAFTADNRPLLGPVEALDGLLAATGLKSTIILTPLVGELVATMVTGSESDPRLAEFSPSRQLH
jgi:sarcosine oxidase subunit beta